MADATIGQLPPASALALSDKIELEQGSSPQEKSAHATLDQLRTLALTAPENVQTGTTYTLVLADAFRLVAMDSTSANAVHVPPHTEAPFPKGARVDLSRDGVGATSVVGGSEAVLVRPPDGMAPTIRVRRGKATLINRGPDLWDIEGNLESVE